VRRSLPMGTRSETIPARKRGRHQSAEDRNTGRISPGAGRRRANGITLQGVRERSPKDVEEI
jgi:hypothetical protein